MPHSHTPAYNLKVVLKETGIAADTLRAWERRYGLPMPQRTDGGHRLYSERDVEIIRWLLAKQESGLSISRAVDMFNEQLASGSDPLADSHPSSGFAPQTLSTTNLDALRDEWLNACLAYNEAQAEQIFNQAFALYPVETVATYLIQQGLHDMGEMWYSGKASVQQEHFASGLAMRRLDTLIAASPAPTRKETILLACPPDEWHTFSLVMLHLFLRRRGFNAVYLGANVPLAHVEVTVQTVKPELIVMVAQQLTTAATLRTTAAFLAKQKYLVAFGGRVFNKVPELQKIIHGEFLGESLHDAEARIEQLVGNPVSIKKRSAGVDSESAQAFREQRGQIEADLKKRLKKIGLSSDDLNAANYYFGNALAASLELGSPAYLTADMDWIKNLLAQHNLPAESLQGYLGMYSQAVQTTMGKVGSSLGAWLNSQKK
jgi:DNA-binding transcriptional MerR regulator